MAGIFVSTAVDQWRGRETAVLDLLRHRGPDGRHHGVIGGGGPLMAQTTLQVQGSDPADAQPAWSADHSTAVLLDGESGTEASSQHSTAGAGGASDAQVLAGHVSRDPRTAPSALCGTWAFVAWNADRAELLAARDPFGMKPLYALLHADGGPTLCSEIRPLLHAPSVRELDEQALAEFLALGRTGPTRTIYRGIVKLLPGCLYRWRRLASGSWQARIESIVPEPGPVVDPQVAIREAVQARLAGEAEVGLILDGSAAGTLLAVLAARQAPGISTFAVSTGLPAEDGSRIAEHTARLLGSRHTTVALRTGDIAERARAAIQVYGAPFGDPSVLPLAALALRAAGDVKVLISAEGAQERHTVRRWGPGRWGPGNGPVSDDLDGLSVLAEARPAADGDLRARLSVDPDSRPGPGRRSLRRVPARGSRSLYEVVLERADRTTMAAGLQVRLPYLDRRVLAARRNGGWLGRTEDWSPSRLLEHLAPGLWMQPAGTVSRELGVDAAATGGPLVDAFRYEIGSSCSVLGRWLGRRGQRAVEARAERSSLLRYRVAILGVWDAELGGERYSCPD